MSFASSFVVAARALQVEQGARRSAAPIAASLSAMRVIPFGSTSTALPIRTFTATISLCTLTIGVMGLSIVVGKGDISSDDMAVTSHQFRPGSGALVSQPNSQARATALTMGHLLEALKLKEDGTQHCCYQP